MVRRRLDPSAVSKIGWKPRFSCDLCRHTDNYSYMLHSSSASSLPSCNTEQAYSIKKACMCWKTSSVDDTKSLHNRSKLAVFVRTAQGLSSNQNEAAVNSKSDLWRTALLETPVCNTISIFTSRCSIQLVAPSLIPHGVRQLKYLALDMAHVQMRSGDYQWPRIKPNGHLFKNRLTLAVTIA